MISLRKSSLWWKYKNYSVWLLAIGVLFLTVNIIPDFNTTDFATSELLPTWQVENPISEIFIVDTIPPTTGSLAAGDTTVPDEYLSDPAIDSLIYLMQLGGTNLYDIVGSDDVVILKCSFQWEFRNNTNNDRIKGLVWKILNHPEGFTGEVLIGDNTQYQSLGPTHNNSDDTNQDILDVINTFSAKGYPVYKYEWMDINESEVGEYSAGDYEDGYIYNPITKVSYPKFQTEAGTYVSLKYGVWDSVSYNRDKLCIINFPVLKAHGPTWGGATEGLKNWMGMLSAAKKNERYGGDSPFHFDYMFSEYALVAKVMQITYPDLTIIDATWTNPERNNTDATVRTGKLLASTDPAAVSWYSTKFVLTPIAYYPESTDPDNDGGRYNKNINYWVNCLQDSGIICTIDSSKISVYNNTILYSISANIKVFLEGPYIGNGLMTTTLNANNLIPLNSDSAYSTAVYGYTTSTVDSIPNADIVDWILVELRTGTEATTMIGRRAAFLKSDGSIVDPDELSQVKFKGITPGNYYIAIRHRNHLPIMSANPISLNSTNSLLFDFSTSQSQAFGTNAMKDLGGDHYGMYAADGNGDGGIYGEDYILYQTSQGQEDYRVEDYNMDGGVYGEDYILYQLNQGYETWVP